MKSKHGLCFVQKPEINATCLSFGHLFRLYCYHTLYGFFSIDICYKQIRHLNYSILVLGVVGFFFLRGL